MQRYAIGLTAFRLLMRLQAGIHDALVARCRRQLAQRAKDVFLPLAKAFFKSNSCNARKNIAGSPISIIILICLITLLGAINSITPNITIIKQCLSCLS